MIIVDSTKDITTILAPLDVGVSEIETETGIALAVSVGFYAPPGIVIDRDNQDISNVEVQVAWAGGTVNAEQVGRWRVGDKAQLVVEIPPTADRTVTLTVRAAIGGDRPYPYRDTVSVALTRQLEAQTLPQQASVA
jgi:hypothetical protein